MNPIPSSKTTSKFVLMQRKPGGYRSPGMRERLLSIIGAENYQTWFRQIWSDLPGTSNRQHPAPYPLEFAERLVRMFSFVDDTVLDPFMGTGTTSVACARWGRNSIGIELDAKYYEMARKTVADYGADLYISSCLTTRAHDHARTSGDYSEPNPELTFAKFVAPLVAQVAAKLRSKFQ